MGDFRQRSGINAVQPDSRNPRMVARVFLKKQPAMTVNSDIVEHPPTRSGQFFTRQQNIDLPSCKWVIDVLEPESPQAAVHVHGETGTAGNGAGRYKVKSVGMIGARIPRAIFGPLEAKDVLRHR